MWVCESRFVTNTHTHPRTHALMHSFTDTKSEHVTSSSKVDNCHIALMVVVTYSLLHEVLQSIVFDFILEYSITSIRKADTHRVCCKFPFVSQFLIFSKAAFITVEFPTNLSFQHTSILFDLFVYCRRSNSGSGKPWRGYIFKFSSRVSLRRSFQFHSHFHAFSYSDLAFMNFGIRIFRDVADQSIRFCHRCIAFASVFWLMWWLITLVIFACTKRFCQTIPGITNRIESYIEPYEDGQIVSTSM